MGKSEIFVKCMLKDSTPYRVVKAIKPNDSIKLSELMEKLKMPEPKLMLSLYCLGQFISIKKDRVKIDKRYDFVTVGDVRAANDIYIRRRHNDCGQEKDNFTLPKVYDEEDYNLPVGK